MGSDSGWRRPQSRGDQFYLSQFVPPELRNWLPKHKSKLPPPPFESLEIEAWTARNYVYSTWILEPPEVQGRIIAHHIHMRMREAYDCEQMMAKTDKPGAHTVADYQKSISERMGVKGAGSGLL